MQFPRDGEPITEDWLRQQVGLPAGDGAFSFSQCELLLTIRKRDGRWFVTLQHDDDTLIDLGEYKSRERFLSLLRGLHIGP